MNPSSLFLFALLVVLVVIVVGPIVGFVMLFRRIHSPTGRVSLTVGWFGVPLSVLCLFGFVGSSRARVERDHSLRLPPSASHIRCGGLVSITTFVDCSANGSFEIAPADLPTVLAAFKWDSEIAAGDLESSSKRMRVPPEFGEPTSWRSGMSRDGNRVFLQTYDLRDGRIGVYIDTIWN